jgi:UPF0271 protein
MNVDLNADLGEGCGQDEALMPLITSANIACGGHAGDPGAMQRTLALAKTHGVKVGAHPGFMDREHFGRRELALPEDQVFRDCLYQIGALLGLAKAEGAPVSYLKAHGALYNLACREPKFARPVVAAAELFDLPVMGLPKSILEAEVRSRGKVSFIAEGFADRRYRPDGSLVPRTEPDAFVHDPAEACKQVAWLVRERGVQSICVHGDNPEAVALVRELRKQLQQAGFTIKASRPR